MWRVMRTDRYGNKGFKDFKTEEDAKAWLASDRVEQDKRDHFSFSLEELSSRGKRG